ncbi:MAG TPA: ATP-binding protein [Cytophagaceae bacterium]|jgi:serine/threonine-protein kinase RsbW|nr:ATP-binding protein [Cytophagaceae bacterium]
MKRNLLLMDKNIKVSCSTKNLKEIRDFVSDTLVEYSVPEMEINMMVLAIDEVCANLIIHSNHCNENQHIELKIKDESQGVSFEISDEGEPFDQSTYREPDIHNLIKEKKKGGIGLMLVKKIMDSIEFTKENDHTICRLFKRVNYAN